MPKLKWRKLSGKTESGVPAIKAGPFRIEEYPISRLENYYRFALDIKVGRSYLSVDTQETLEKAKDRAQSIADSILKGCE